MQKLVLPIEKQQEIIKFYLVPNSLHDTSKKFNLSRAVITSILLKNNVEKHSAVILNALHDKNSQERGAVAIWKQLSTETVKDIIEFYLVPNTIAETARKFNLLRQDISKLLVANNIKKHGAEIYTQLQQKAMTTTNLNKYGVAYQMQLNDNKAKRTATYLKRYGKDNPAKVTSIKNKIKQTCIAKYGVDSYVKTAEFAKTHRSIYFYDNNYFDSSWELAVYIYAKDHDMTIVRLPLKLTYFVGTTEHSYFPDFFINGELIEIKGDHLIDKNTLLNIYEHKLLIEKTECMFKNNVVIWPYSKCKPYIQYVKTTYGSKFMKQFKLQANTAKLLDDQN